MKSALYNRQQMRRYNWLSLWLQDRQKMYEVTDAKWKAYQTLIEMADMMSYRYFEKHLENV